MAYLNVKSRSLETKIVYYGAGLSGKTTNLEIVKKHSEEGRCGEMMSLNTAGDRTLFFDWIPFHMGKVNGCDVKMQLYTVPGQAKYAETRRRVLAGADGIVLVLDSQSSAVERNLEIVADLREQMAANHLTADNCPIVVQLNKRDLPNAMRVEDLVRELSLDRMVTVEAVASTGQGVFETLREATRLVLASVRRNAREDGSTFSAGEASGLDGQTLYASLTEGKDPSQLPVGFVPPRIETNRANGAPVSGAPSTPSTPSTPSAPSTRSTPSAAPSSLGGTPSSGSAAPSARSAVPVTPASSKPGSAPTSAPQTSPSRVPVPSASAGSSGSVSLTAAANGRVVEGVPSAAGFGEVLAGVRAMSVRLDALEPTLTRAVSSQTAELERRLASRVEQAVEQKLAVVARTVAGTVDSSDAQHAEIMNVIVVLAERAERAERAAAEASAVSSQLVAAMTSLAEDVRGRLTESSAETERRVLRITQDAARDAALMEERTNQALGNLRELVFKDATALAERVGAEQKVAQKSLLEPLAAVRARLLEDSVLDAQRDDELRAQLGALRSEIEGRLTALVEPIQQHVDRRLNEVSTEIRETNRGVIDDRLGSLLEEISGRSSNERALLERRLGQWFERVPDVGAIKIVVEASVGKPLGEMERRLLALNVATAESGVSLDALKGDVGGAWKDVRALAATFGKSAETQQHGVEELARELRQAEVALGQRIDAAPLDVARALATPLTRTSETMSAAVSAVGANVAGSLALVNESLAATQTSLVGLSEQLCDPTGKPLPKALEDVWTHTHNHFSTVEDALRRLAEEFQRASVDAKGRPWWKG
jgi:mutual gliding-motility protein MglA